MSSICNRLIGAKDADAGMTDRSKERIDVVDRVARIEKTRRESEEAISRVHCQSKQEQSSDWCHWAEKEAAACRASPASLARTKERRR